MATSKKKTTRKKKTATLTDEEKGTLLAAYTGQSLSKPQEKAMSRMAKKYGTVPLFGWGRRLVNGEDITEERLTSMAP